MAVALALALALAVVVGVSVAMTIALACGLIVAVAVGLALAFRLALAVGLALAQIPSVALERASLSRAHVTTSVALALLMPVGVVLSLLMLLRGLLALLRGEALLRTRPDCVAVAEVCGQRSLRDVDRHEGVLLRVSVVTDRHLGRWVLSGGSGDV